MVNFRRSLVITFFSTSGATIVQFIVSLVLARMLSPSEIGVFSMTVVFVNIAHMFRDFGVTSYLQREPQLTPEKIRAATGMLFTTSWLIALVLFLASPWIASWFAEPRIEPVMKVLAAGFLFIPFGAITNTLLTREFAADKQAIVSAAGTISYAVSCLGLAALGFGTMSLAWANLVNIIACAIACVPLRPKGVPWLPSFRNWRGVAQFGIGSLVANCISAINNAVPDVLLGKLGGPHQVGLLSRANSTVTIFSYIAGATINYGSLAYISQAHHRGDSLAPLLSRATTLLTGIGWPVLAITTLLGKEIVVTLYGSKWLDCVPAIPGLAIAVSISMAFNYIPLALIAIGRPYLSAVPATVNLLTRIAFGIAFFDGSIFRFSWAICAASLASIPINVFQQRRYLGYGIRHSLRALWPSAQVTFICVIGCELLKLALPASLPDFARILILALPLVAIWYVALRVTKHPLLDEVHHLSRGIRSRLFRHA